MRRSQSVSLCLSSQKERRCTLSPLCVFVCLAAAAATALCHYLKAFARANCLADDAASLLNCEGLEVEVAKYAAVRYQTAANSAAETKGAEEAAKCVSVVSFLRAYIDVSVMIIPHFRVFRQGATPSAALNEAFSHWGIQRDADGDVVFTDAPRAELGKDGRPHLVKPKTVFLETCVPGCQKEAALWGEPAEACVLFVCLSASEKKGASCASAGTPKQPFAKLKPINDMHSKCKNSTNTQI